MELFFLLISSLLVSILNKSVVDFVVSETIFCNESADTVLAPRALTILYLISASAFVESPVCIKVSAYSPTIPFTLSQFSTKTSLFGSLSKASINSLLLITNPLTDST